MKIHLRFDEDSNEEHSKCTLFINGKNCGRIITGVAEAVYLHDILAKGIDSMNVPELKDFEFLSSGSQNVDDEKHQQLMQTYSKQWNNA